MTEPTLPNPSFANERDAFGCVGGHPHVLDLDQCCMDDDCTQKEFLRCDRCELLVHIDATRFCGEEGLCEDCYDCRNEINPARKEFYD